MVKSLRNVIGYQTYKELYIAKDGTGKQLIDLLESYGRIARNLADEKLINIVTDFIKSRLKQAEKFYLVIGDLSDVGPETSNAVIKFRKRHLAVAKNIHKVILLFANAKTRTDKVIAIDTFMHTAHELSGNIVTRLWEYPSETASKYEAEPGMWLDYLAGISVR